MGRNSWFWFLKKNAPKQLWIMIKRCLWRYDPEQREQTKKRHIIIIDNFFFFFFFDKKKYPKITPLSVFFDGKKKKKKKKKHWKHWDPGYIEPAKERLKGLLTGYINIIVYSKNEQNTYSGRVFWETTYLVKIVSNKFLFLFEVFFSNEIFIHQKWKKNLTIFFFG